MRVFTLPFCAIVAVSSAALAADAPQYRGPSRDGIFKDTGLLQAWPEGGPALAWTAAGIGKGYSSPAVVGDTVYITGMLDDGQGYLFALDLAGKEKWRAAYGKETQDKQATGSRGTPTVDGDRVYIMSGVGALHCVSAADGAKIWEVDVFGQFQGQATMWAIAESPLIDGNNVIVTPGGPDATLVALDKSNGKTVWTCNANSQAPSYCSAIIYEVGGRKLLTTMTAKAVIGVDPKDGALLWSHPKMTKYDIHAVTPAIEGNILYYTAGYGSGGGALELSADGSKAKEIWTDLNLDCQHHGIILLNGHIYGTGHNNSKLMCLDLKTGKPAWETDEVSQGSIAYADGMLYVYEGPRKGIVSLVKARPEKYERTGSFTIPENRDKHWAHPVIAAGHLFIRHAGNLYAYKVTQ